MNLEEVRIYCLSKPGAEESFPFDSETPVYKTCGKIFAITGLNPPYSVNLKCDPEKALELRERYEGIVPGYHMSKKHWNTVDLEGSVPKKLICELIDHSFELVFNSIPVKKRNEFLENNSND